MTKFPRPASSGASRRNLTWKDPYTESKPRRNRKATEPEQIHNESEWMSRQGRIKELYGTYPLKEVRDILAREGFQASVKQYKDRLEEWGIYKYIKLSAKQYAYVARVTDERYNLGKKTSYRLSGVKLPSKDLQRNLRARIAKCMITDFSSVSSSGLAPSTCSSQSDGVQLKEGLKEDPNVIELRKRYPNDEFTINYYSDIQSFIFDCIDCQVSVYKTHENLLDHLASFEQYHLLNRHHRSMVQLKVSNLSLETIRTYDRKHCFHLTLIEHLILFCGHSLFPTAQGWLQQCLEPGGCIWWRTEINDQDYVSEPHGCQCWRLKINEDGYNDPLEQEVLRFNPPIDADREAVLTIGEGISDSEGFTTVSYQELTGKPLFEPLLEGSCSEYSDREVLTGWIEDPPGFGRNTDRPKQTSSPGTIADRGNEEGFVHLTWQPLTLMGSLRRPGEHQSVDKNKSREQTS